MEDEARFEELFSLPSSFFFSFAEFLSLSLWLTLVFLDLCSNRPRSLSSRPLFSAQRWLLLLLTLSSSPLSLSLPFPSLSLSLSLSLFFLVSLFLRFLSPLPPSLLPFPQPTHRHNGRDVADVAAAPRPSSPSDRGRPFARCRAHTRARTHTRRGRGRACARGGKSAGPLCRAEAPVCGLRAVCRAAGPARRLCLWADRHRQDAHRQRPAHGATRAQGSGGVVHGQRAR